MQTANVIMLIANIIALIALVFFGIFAVYNNKPNFELTPGQLRDQKTAQNYGIWVVIAIVVSWLATLPGLFDNLSSGVTWTMWWIELVANIVTTICAIMACIYYGKLNRAAVADDE